MSVRRCSALPWLLAFSVCSSGCREELGRDPFVTTRVTGTVRLGSKPVEGGWIEFAPFDGAVGTLRSAPIRPDGTFEADAVAVGTNSVAIVGASLPSPYRQRFDALPTPIRRVIPAGASATLDVNLLEELVLWQSKAVPVGGK